MRGGVVPIILLLVACGPLKGLRSGGLPTAPVAPGLESLLTMTSPVTGQSASGSVFLSVQLLQIESIIQRVVYYTGESTEVAASSIGPHYAVALPSSFPMGGHQIWAEAYDSSGNKIVTSEKVTVTLRPIGFSPDRHPVIDFLGVPGDFYEVIATDDLSTWSVIGVKKAHRTTGAFSFEDTESASHGMRFYRARIPVTSPGPAPVASLQGAAVSSTEVGISWVDTSDNENEIQVEKSATEGGPYVSIATLAADSQEFSSTNLTPGTTYYFRVRTLNNQGSSASQPVRVVTLP